MSYSDLENATQAIEARLAPRRPESSHAAPDQCQRSRRNKVFSPTPWWDNGLPWEFNLLLAALLVCLTLATNGYAVGAYLGAAIGLVLFVPLVVLYAFGMLTVLIRCFCRN